jgi:hypothetical protein
MIRKLLTIITLLFFIITVKSQNTVGVITNTSDTFDGFTIFTSHTETYLINNCGEVINQWTSDYPPGNAVYLLENGNVLRAGSTNSADITLGGQGGVIELFDWDGDLVWQYFYDTPQYRQHHDIYPMPNGNILILAAKVMTNFEAILAGRNPDLLPQGVLYSEQIVEVEPVGFNQANIVWEWDIKNHLIQDFDATKNNFGSVSENKHKLDINFTNGLNGSANWLHVNSIQYNEELDQIVLSSRNLSEIWIIDHSTTTSEAASSSGGIYGKGGDILYRWGNPQAYKQGSESDRKLYGQHYPHWIGENLIDEGKIILFNNGNGRIPQFSEVYIINPPISSPGFYISETTFGPVEPDYIYADTVNVPSTFNSAILSGAERLPNGNILICEGITGTIFEIDNNNNKVWEYINPTNNITGAISSQGNNPASNNQLFRAKKYPLNYPAFEGRDLTPGNPIELNSEINEPCTVLSIDDFVLNNLKLSPNPTSNIVNIETTTVITKIEVYNILGSKINMVENSNSVDLSNFESGMYLLKIVSNDATITKRVIKN